MTEFTEAPASDAESAGIKPDFQARLKAVPVTDDVVAYTMACFLALTPRTSAQIAQAVERQVRDYFGGDKSWIASMAARDLKERNAQIRRDYQMGERIELLERRYELSKRRLFQIVSDK